MGDYPAQVQRSQIQHWPQQDARSPYIVNPMLLAIYLQGLYTALFIICTYLLVRSRKRQHIPFLLTVIIMFTLAMTDIVLRVRDFENNRSTDPRGNNYHDHFFLANDIVANGLLIYRLYIIWDRNWRVIILPCGLMVAATAVALCLNFGTGALVYVNTTVIVNVSTSVLLAGRIWWMARKLSEALGPSHARRYNAAVVIAIESGVISTVYMVLDMIFPSFCSPSLTQVVGIVPTLVIVQVALGREVQDLHTTIKSARNRDIEIRQHSCSVVNITPAVQHDPNPPGAVHNSNLPY